MEVKIRDYQVIQRAELSIKGFTCLIGNSHSGKSSFLRAVETALYNHSGNNYIRVGSNATEVSLEFKYKEHPISWAWHKSKSPVLEYNQQLFKKLGASCPQELLKEVGFPEVVIGESRFRPHFQRQLSPLFGVSEKPTTLFNLLLSFSESDNLPRIRKTVDQDLASLEIDRKSLERQTKENTLSLKSLSGFVKEFESSVSWRQFKGLIKVVEQQEELKKIINSYLENLSKIESLEIYLSKASILVRYQKDLDSKLDSTRQLTRVVKNITSCREDLSGYLAYKRSAVPLQKELERFKEEADQLELQRGMVREYRSLLNSLNKEESILGLLKTKRIKLEKQLSSIEVCPVCSAPIKNGKYCL